MGSLTPLRNVILKVGQGAAFRTVSHIPSRPMVSHPRNRAEMDASLKKAECAFLSYKKDMSCLSDQNAIREQCVKHELAVALMQKAASMPGQLEGNLKIIIDDNKSLRGQIKAGDCLEVAASFLYSFKDPDISHDE